MVLKITRDELPIEYGVYGGCLLCLLYPLLMQEEDCRMIYTGICLISGHMRVIDYKYSFILPSVYNREF